MTKPKDNIKLCGANRKKGAGKCKRTAGHGTAHLNWGTCFEHGGNTPALEKAAAREEAAAQIAKTAGYSRRVAIEPHQALLLCIEIVAGEIAYAEEMVSRLQEEEILTSPTEVLERPLKEEKGAENPGIVVKETKYLSQQLNAWIQIRQDGMDRLVRYSAAALKSGLEERLVRVAEIQGKLMAEAVKGILTDLGVIDHPDAPRVVRRHLTAIASASVT